MLNFGTVFPCIKFQYREYMGSHGKIVKPLLQKLLHCVNAVLVNTADYELGFNKYLINILDGRSVAHNSSVMFVSLNGSPTEMWGNQRPMSSYC